MIPYVIVLLVLAIFHVATRYSRKGRLFDRLPGYTAYPLVGNLLKFNITCPQRLWQLKLEMMKEFYPITRIWFVKSAVVVLGHPDDAEILLTSQMAIEKGWVYDYFHPWLGTGLLNSTGDKWRERRKILTPAFHFNILKRYLEIMNEQGEKCMLDLKREGSETTKSLVHFASDVTLNVICESAMGVALDKYDRKSLEIYKQAIHDYGQVIVFRLPRPYVFDWMMKLPWSWANVQRETVKILHKFSGDVIKERREYHHCTDNAYLKQLDDEKVDEEEDAYAMGGRKKRLAMLDLLLAAEKNGSMDAQGVQEEVDTFTFEGHDTSGMALAYTLMLLAENEEAQRRARTEAVGVIEKSTNGGRLDMNDVAALGYLERCVKESLRLYPPTSTVFRYVPEDLQLKHALIPGGSHAMLNIFDIHRDANFWENPEKFDPDRFLPENAKNRHAFAYLPFSAGPRNCIGQKFAMLELKTLLAKILHDFRLEPIDRSCDVKLIADILIRPAGPIRVKFVKLRG